MVPLITAIVPSVILSKVKLQLNLLFVFLFLDVYYTYINIKLRTSLNETLVFNCNYTF